MIEKKQPESAPVTEEQPGRPAATGSPDASVAVTPPEAPEMAEEQEVPPAEETPDVPVTEEPPASVPAVVTPPEPLSPWEESWVGIDPDNPDLDNWYIVNTYSGHEHKVKQAIENRIAADHWEERVTHVLVPMERVEEVKRGKKVMVERRMYPGYVLIQMAPDLEIWNQIHRIPGVSGFIGAGGKPTQVQKGEVKLIFDQMFGRRRRPRLKILYELGENVRIVVGPFTDFTGKISEIDEERGKLKLVVDIFGRATPVEVELEQVERL